MKTSNTKPKPVGPSKITAPGSPTRLAKAQKKNFTQPESIVETGLAVTQRVNGNLMKFDKALPLAKSMLADGLQQLTATLAMRDLEPLQVREVFDYSAGLADAVDEAKKLARARVLSLILESGEATGSGESKKFVYPDGRTQLAKATKVGIDPKKFEAALRAKGIEVVKYMVPDIKYKLPSDYDAPKQAIDDGLFTADEIKTLNYEPAFAVERSKEGKND